MEEEPIISFKGRNGKVELYEDMVRLDRGTLGGFFSQGLKGNKDIYLKNITSIQIKKPGLSVGYLQFSVPGYNESKKGLFNALKDENTIAFDGETKYEMALELKKYIENNFNKSGKNSAAEEIEKLHSLMQKGIITKKEFENKKKKLLE